MREHLAFASSYLYLSNFAGQLQCLQRASGRRVPEKSQLFHTNHRSADLGDQTQATCGAGSGDNSSANHYDWWHVISICHFVIASICEKYR
jgi:hypothetical protein